MERTHTEFRLRLREMANRFFHSCIRTQYDRTSHTEMLVLMNSQQGRHPAHARLRELVLVLPTEFSATTCRGSLALMDQLNREAS